MNFGALRDLYMLCCNVSCSDTPSIKKFQESILSIWISFSNSAIQNSIPEIQILGIQNPILWNIIHFMGQFYHLINFIQYVINIRISHAHDVAYLILLDIDLLNNNFSLFFNCDQNSVLDRLFRTLFWYTFKCYFVQTTVLEQVWVWYDFSLQTVLTFYCTVSI